MKHNPYIGPRPYERQDRRNFYGRTREARELCALIRSEREVLFYAQSGAGKTSLLNASVIPMLEEQDFVILPVARVGSEVPLGVAADAVANVFVFSTLLTLAGEDVAPQALLSQTLCDYLRPLCNVQVANGDADVEATTLRPVVLILDQFEELFTTHRERWSEAEGFFRQMREALDTLPNLGVVLAMREDHVAAIDPYAPHFPRRLRARFRMERLGPRGALAAVERPAENAGCCYDPGVAERLVNNLRRIKVRPPSVPPTGGIEGGQALGPYVEPVQLQVVCSRLWAQLPEQEDHAIQWEEVEQYGDIDRALIDFYESAVAAAVKRGGVNERQVRRWFGEELITQAETRGLVLRGDAETADLPNAAVDALEAAHIIRAERRAGARWYELAHDRLVEPILDANRVWEAAQAQLHPWRPAARQWQQAQSETLLYRGEELEAAQAWLEAADPGAVEAYEREFIEASGEAARARARTRRLAVAGGVFAVVIIAVLATLTTWAIRSSQEAKDASRDAVARMLGVQGQLVFEDDPLLGMGLALEGLALLTPNDIKAEADLTTQLAEMARYGRLLKLGDDVEEVYPSPDGLYFVVDRADAPGELRRTTDGALVASLSGMVEDVYFSPDLEATSFIVRYADAPGELRRTTDDTLVVPLAGMVEDVYFSPDPAAASFVVSYKHAPGELRQTTDGMLLVPLTGEVKQVDFSPDPAATTFFVAYANAPGELRQTADGVLVVSLDGAVRQLHFGASPAATCFFVEYAEGPGELHWTTDDAPVVPLAGEVDWVYFSSDPAVTSFVVDYADAAGELRQTTDGALVAPLSGEVGYVKFSPDPAATSFVVIYDDTSGELRRTTDGALVAPLPGELTDVYFSPDPAATTLVVAYADAPGELRQTADGTLLAPLAGVVYGVYFSPDPAVTSFVVTYYDTPDELRLAADGALVTPLAGEVERIHFSPDPAAASFVVDYEDAPGELRRTADGTLMTPLADEVYEIYFSPDPAAATFVVAYADAPGELRRTADGTLVSALADEVYGVYFSPDPAATSRIVAYRNGSNELWHSDGYRLADLGLGLETHFFDPDARRLIVQHTDGRVYLLDVAWLTAMRGAPEDMTLDALTRVICEGPVATRLLDEDKLLDYLDGRPLQLCIEEDECE